MMRVKNRGGTAKLSCRCDSWLAHWERFSNRKADACANVDCSNSAVVGGHVIDAFYLSMDVGIVPICQRCNSQGPDFRFAIDESKTPPVSANTQRTCA